jgi:hypothetical protein
MAMTALGPGCVKTRDRRVFRGPFTIPDLEKRHSERSERSGVVMPMPNLRFYTAWVETGR